MESRVIPTWVRIIEITPVEHPCIQLCIMKAPSAEDNDGDDKEAKNNLIKPMHHLARYLVLDLFYLYDFA